MEIHGTRFKRGEEEAERLLMNLESGSLQKPRGVPAHMAAKL